LVIKGLTEEKPMRKRGDALSSLDNTSWSMPRAARDNHWLTDWS
jgi:hypothetical protein